MENHTQAIEKCAEVISEGLEKEEEKNFISALSFMATLTDEDIDKNKADIENQVDVIREFVSKSTSGNAEIRNLFGFKDKKEKFNFKTNQKSYCFFVADLKIKATIFIIRSYKFMNMMRKIDYNEIKKEFTDLINNDKYKNLLDVIKKETDIDYNKITNEGIENEELKNIIEIFSDKISLKFQDNTTEYKGINDRIQNIVENTNLANNKLSLSYYLFDNSMHDVAFYGTKSKLLWSWESRSATLYHNISLKTDFNDKENKQNGVSTRIDYVKAMFKNMINHINSHSQFILSYSTNPVLDIFKYLYHPCQDGQDVFSFCASKESDTDNSLKISLTNKNNIEKDEKCKFGIAKNIQINNIRNSKTCVDFYTFLSGNAEEKLTSDYYFCIEPFNPIRNGNESGRLASRLCTYLGTWCNDDEQLKKLYYSKVSERDDEVICAKGYIKDEDETEYELTPHALVRLLVKIRMAIDNIQNDDDLANKIAKKCIVEISEEKNFATINRKTKNNIIIISCDELSVKVKVDDSVNLPEDKVDKNKIKKMIANAIIEYSNSTTDDEKNNIEKIMESIREYINENRDKFNGIHPAFNCDCKQYHEQHNECLCLIKQLLLGGK
ncbi:MAG: hypothetical protein LUG56_03685 [Lachnospiraceae bacterium]|nr:hypothetical protein [Lachnospiraceae bacterium]